MPAQPPAFLLLSQVLLWLAVAALGALMFILVRQLGLLHERISPVGALHINRVARAGERAPSLQLDALDGTLLTVGAARADERSLLLFFISPACPVCKTLLDVMRAVSRAESDWLDILYASDGPPGEHAEFVARHHLPPARYVLSETLGRAFGVSRLPYAVLIAPDGTISAMGLVNNREHVESLFEAQARGVASLQEYLGREHTPTLRHSDRRTADVPS